ncbi:hypothetical protein ACLB2K_042816 [Fragaria x ananassa]
MSETTNYPKPNKKLCIRGNKAMESEWQNLPMDVAFLIQVKLFEPVDHLCFARVCKEWEPLSKDYNKATHHLQSTSHFLELYRLPFQIRRTSRTAEHFYRKEIQQDLFATDLWQEVLWL